MRITILATAAALALGAGACNNNSDGGSNLSTEANLADDAAANDVLGGNALTDNEAATAIATDENGVAPAN